MLRALLLGGLLFVGSRDSFAADDVPRVINFTVTIVSSSSDKLRGDFDVAELQKRIAELEKTGNLDGLTRLQFSGLERQEVKLQFGESVPVVSSRQTGFGGRGGTGNPGFPVANSFTREQVGTLVAATAMVDAQGVVAELIVEQSKLEPKKPADDGAFEPASTSTLHLKSTVRIPRGQTVVLAGIQEKSAPNPRQTLVLISASLPEGTR